MQATLSSQACVLVSLRQIMGSAPREPGCRMIVSAAGVQGSIGGGNLEFTAIARAREFLRESQSERQFLEPFGLGPELNQCCGGAVQLLFEHWPAGHAHWLDELVKARAGNQPVVLATKIDQDSPQHWTISAHQPSGSGCPEQVRQAAERLLQDAAAAGSAKDPGPGLEIEAGGGRWWLERIADNFAELWLFGAGHVGQEVAQRVRGLPFRLHWVDQRPDIFPTDAAAFAELVCSDPVAAVNTARADSIFVVMSHSHGLDEDICHAILQGRDAESGDSWDFAWLGLIGSATKRKRFLHRLRQRGIPEPQLERLVCPIGLAGIHGKQPATIALSLLAQLMSEPAQGQSRRDSVWTDANN